MMQEFWTGEIIAVVALGLMGFILLTFVMAWLQQGRTTKIVGKARTFADPRDNSELTQFTTNYMSGNKIVLFIITSSLVLMIGAVGVILFAFDLWNAPMYVNIMDINIQFIFVIFAIFTFVISMTIAALYAWSKNTTKGGGRYR